MRWYQDLEYLSLKIRQLSTLQSPLNFMTELYSPSISSSRYARAKMPCRVIQLTYFLLSPV